MEENIYKESKDMYIATRLLLVISITRKTNIKPKQLNQTTDSSDLTNTSSASNSGARRSSGSNRLALEIGQEGSISSTKSTRATESVQLAGVAKGGSAGSIGSGSGGTEQLSSVAEKRGHDVLEDVALSNDLATGSDVESVARVGIPVVVDGMDERVSADLGAAAGGVVDVVVLHGDEVGGASQVDGPIVVAIAGGGPAGHTIELIVGEGHAIRGASAGDEHLAADEGDLDMIYLAVLVIAEMGRGPT